MQYRPHNLGMLEYQIINLILGILFTCQAMPSGVPDRWEGLDGCNSSAKHIPHISSIGFKLVSMLVMINEITSRLKRIQSEVQFSDNVCNGERRALSSINRKFSTHGPPEQTYMLFRQTTS
ncbi:hypothetical protein AVEN_160247-1 [Araneus ventricosus]|uniref:Uncharacterized protein n=1 Tax=Araneus ventricosus TaxID=182803 RepID=A0A4Y2UCP4_ARAVE|nr:hypothetical protein AVEN_160247-1 [Araneus ventricosus]